MLRRIWLTQFALAISAGLLSGCGRVKLRTSSLAAPLALLELLGDDVVREIGLAFIAAHADATDTRTLRRELLVNARSTGLRPVFEFQWERQVREEFVARHTINVGGWVLSISEARRCALYAMATRSTMA